MGPFEIATIVVVGLAVIGIIAYFIVKKVRGESISCDCGSCGGCPHCNACKTHKSRKPENGAKK